MLMISPLAPAASAAEGRHASIVADAGYTDLSDRGATDRFIQACGALRHWTRINSLLNETDFSAR
jgi:hypothetical protein